MERPTFLLKLQATPGAHWNGDAYNRLKLAEKALLRTWGLRVLNHRELREGETVVVRPPQQEATGEGG